MKNLIILLFALSEVCFAGGSGSGTLPSASIRNSDSSIGSTVSIGSSTMDIDSAIQKHFGNDRKSNRYNRASDIIFYQGETEQNVFIQYGTSKGRSWMIEGIKIDKQSSDLNSQVMEAIVKSKITNDWSKIHSTSDLYNSK